MSFVFIFGRMKSMLVHAALSGQKKLVINSIATYPTMKPSTRRGAGNADNDL
jgi:hypothetical protein